MENMKKYILLAAKAAIAFGISIVLLSGFSLFFSYDGVHIDNKTGATDYTWEPGQLKTTMREGHAMLRMDKNGFNDSYAASDDIDILLMGSSHMEAVNVASNKNTGYLLNELVPYMYTYNIGISGHTIYNCVNNMTNAIKAYNPCRYVVIETSTAELDMKSMETVVNNEYKKIPSYDTGIMYWLQKNIPAVKSLYKQADEWMAYDKKSSSNGDKNDKENNISETDYKGILDDFLKRAATPVKENGCELIIFYHPTEEIDENGRFIFYTNEKTLSMFSKACEKNGIRFIDMTDDFTKMYENRHVLPHGFINTAVGVGHLNEYGHEAIAERLSKEIQ